MDAKNLTKIVLIVVAALFLFETETAALIVAVWDTVRGVPVPQQTTGFISGGILYAAGVLGIHSFKNGNGNGGDKSA
jgi:hypothetical protein